MTDYHLHVAAVTGGIMFYFFFLCALIGGGVGLILSI